MSKYPESVTHHDPDESYHELKNFLFQALKCGPNSLELLYTPSEEEEPFWGDRLRLERSSVLSARAVRSSFLGYADAQMKRMASRTTFESPKRAKLLKHAFRLVDQGLRLYADGEMRVKVHPEDRDFYLTLGERSNEELIKMYEKRLEKWGGASSPLPDDPDIGSVNQFLLEYRKAH